VRVYMATYDTKLESDPARTALSAEGTRRRLSPRRRVSPGAPSASGPGVAEGGVPAGGGGVPAGGQPGRRCGGRRVRRSQGMSRRERRRRRARATGIQVYPWRTCNCMYAAVVLLLNRCARGIPAAHADGRPTRSTNTLHRPRRPSLWTDLRRRRARLQRPRRRASRWQHRLHRSRRRVPVGRSRLLTMPTACR